MQVKKGKVKRQPFNYGQGRKAKGENTGNLGNIVFFGKKSSYGMRAGIRTVPLLEAEATRVAYELGVDFLFLRDFATFFRRLGFSGLRRDYVFSP